MHEVAEQLAKALDISQGWATLLTLALAAFLVAWALSWIFLPWFLFSKLNHVSESLGRIFDRLGKVLESLPPIRAGVQSGVTGVSQLNDRARSINSRLDQLMRDHSPK